MRAIFSRVGTGEATPATKDKAAREAWSVDYAALNTLLAVNHPLVVGGDDEQWEIFDTMIAIANEKTGKVLAPGFRKSKADEPGADELQLTEELRQLGFPE